MKNENSLKQLMRFKSVHLFVLFATLNLALFTGFANGQTTPKYALGANLLSKTEYAKLPRANWDTLRLNSNKQAIATLTSSIVMLTNPPIGDQGILQGSCVGWAVGYAATSILAYSKYNDWTTAKRSPSYVYNQIKVNSDCLSGTYVTSALNLVNSQGDCSWSLMPYVNSDCATLPNNTQKFDASLNNIITWRTLAPNDVTGIKQALSLGYPVVIGFSVYQSFYDMWNTGGGIWNTPNSGTNYGGHATCIVGYDDTKQMFKVQNSWGTTGGNQGYFWVTYSLIQNNCINEAYILSGMNQSIYPTLSGNSQVCSQSTYTINNLQVGATVSWSVTPSNIVSLQQNGSSATLTKIGNGLVTLSATINNIYTMTKDIWVGLPKFPAYTTNPSILCPNEPYTFSPLILSGFTITSATGLSGGVEVPLSEIPPGTYEVPGDVVRITLTIENSCGSITVRKLIPKVNCMNYSFSIAPNPTSEIVTIQLLEGEENNTRKVITETDYEVQLWNDHSDLVKSIKSREPSFQIPLKGFPKGMYYLHLLMNGTTTQKQILWVK